MTKLIEALRSEIGEAGVGVGAGYNLRSVHPDGVQLETAAGRYELVFDSRVACLETTLTLKDCSADKIPLPVVLRYLGEGYFVAEGDLRDQLRDTFQAILRINSSQVAHPDFDQVSLVSFFHGYNAGFADRVKYQKRMQETLGD